MALSLGLALGIGNLLVWSSTVPRNFSENVGWFVIKYKPLYKSDEMIYVLLLSRGISDQIFKTIPYHVHTYFNIHTYFPLPSWYCACKKSSI